MSEFDPAKNYYEILGADSQASRRDIDRLYKRKAAHHHPDRGGNEEEMKVLNEAYRVLKNEITRRDYDAARVVAPEPRFVPVATPTASDIGLFGHGLSAFLCLLVGFFLLVLVRTQWIWFLWPLAILAALVIVFGVLMARGAMLAANTSLPSSHVLRRHTTLQEIVFWLIVGSAGYGLYLLLSAVG